jgi:hypothetical protein
LSFYFFGPIYVHFVLSQITPAVLLQWISFMDFMAYCACAHVHAIIDIAVIINIELYMFYELTSSLSIN